MAEQFASGVELMIIGMGIVFLFLALLVVLVNGMSLVITRFFAEAPAPAATTPSKRTTTPVQEEDEVIAAISAAVHRYRQTQFPSK